MEILCKANHAVLKHIFPQKKKKKTNIKNWWKRFDQKPMPNIYIHTQTHLFDFNNSFYFSSIPRYSHICFSFPLNWQKNSYFTCFKISGVKNQSISSKAVSSNTLLLQDLPYCFLLHTKTVLHSLKYIIYIRELCRLLWVGQELHIFTLLINKNTYT